MAYIGNSPANVGNYQAIDSVASSFNGSTTTFALAAGGASITPGKSGQIVVNINGVSQQPDDSGSEGFRVVGSNIVFSSAPASGDTFWAVFQGQNVDIGTPSDDVVDTVHIKANAVTNVKIDSVAATKLTGNIAAARLTAIPAANLTGTIAAARLATGATQAESDNSTKLATTAYVTTKITTLIGGAPSTLNDLNELAAAINDDNNYNSTLTTALATKLPKAGGAMTGAITTNSTFDGRDVATDGSKLDGIAASANNYVHPNHSGEVTSTADGATVIAANVVDEANLKVSNSPTNGFLLSAQSGNAGGLTWITVAPSAVDTTSPE